MTLPRKVIRSHFSSTLKFYENGEKSFSWRRSWEKGLNTCNCKHFVMLVCLSGQSILFQPFCFLGIWHKGWNEYLKQFIFISFLHSYTHLYVRPSMKPTEMKVGKLLVGFWEQKKVFASYKPNINFIFMEKNSTLLFFSIAAMVTIFTWRVFGFGWAPRWNKLSCGCYFHNSYIKHIMSTSMFAAFGRSESL